MTLSFSDFVSPCHQEWSELVSPGITGYVVRTVLYLAKKGSDGITFSFLMHFRYHLPYRRLFGGAIAVQRVHFTAVNGFANRFYGWGGEDDDFYNRVERKGLSIIRFDPQVATYVMLSHESLPPSDNRFLLLNEGLAISSEDGLSNLSYELIEKKVMPLYTLFKVMC